MAITKIGEEFIGYGRNRRVGGGSGGNGFPFSGVRQRRNTLNKAEFARSLENRCPEYLMDMKEQLDAAIAKTKQPGKSSAKA